MDFGFIAILTGIIVIFIGIYFKNLKFKANNKEEENENIPELQIEKKKKNTSENFGKIYFLFASQTGTANKFSTILSNEAEEEGFEPTIIDLMDYKFFDFQNKICVFLIATHGEGDPTDNSKEFYEWLLVNDETKNVLKNLKFTVFGLGNTQYESYNSMGKKVNELLGKYGALRLDFCYCVFLYYFLLKIFHEFNLLDFLLFFLLFSYLENMKIIN